MGVLGTKDEPKKTILTFLQHCFFLTLLTSGISALQYFVRLPFGQIHLQWKAILVHSSLSGICVSILIVVATILIFLAVQGLQGLLKKTSFRTKLFIKSFAPSALSFLIQHLFWVLGGTKPWAYFTAYWITAGGLGGILGLLIHIHFARRSFPEGICPKRRWTHVFGWLFIPCIILSTFLGLVSVLIEMKAFTVSIKSMVKN